MNNILIGFSQLIFKELWSNKEKKKIRKQIFSYINGQMRNLPLFSSDTFCVNFVLNSWISVVVGSIFDCGRKMTSYSH